MRPAYASGMGAREGGAFPAVASRPKGWDNRHIRCPKGEGRDAGHAYLASGFHRFNSVPGAARVDQAAEFHGVDKLTF